jgi:hypothetical protein
VKRAAGTLAQALDFLRELDFHAAIVSRRPGAVSRGATGC